MGGGRRSKRMKRDGAFFVLTNPLVRIFTFPAGHAFLAEGGGRQTPGEKKRRAPERRPRNS